jgi:outer membrane receptor for ferrienterochelin and colicins
MRYSLILLCFITSWSAAAQSVRGKVLFPGGNEPVEMAQLFWLGASSDTYSGADGTFELAVENGFDTLVCKYAGYPEWKMVVTDPAVWIEIVLPDPIAAPTVIIEGEQRAQELNLLDAQKFQTLNEKELCKAACCSLSESFETNASVDASYTDAVTGTRQIKMLGLDGKYSQVMFDNIPSVRGLASIYGLGYLPGPWIREISIVKGAGSVIAGYESITGQINVAHKSSEMKERVFVNAYAGSQGRLEFNSVIRTKVSEQWSSTVLAHIASSQLRFDMNDDGFLDNPLFTNAIVRNEWKYVGKKGMRGEYALVYSEHHNTSGQFDFDPRERAQSALWGVDTDTRRAELSAKTGFVFPEQEWKSFGSQVNISWHNQEGFYGNRNYSGEQRSARVNLLYASEITEELKFTSGLSYVYDEYNEQLDSSSFDRIESIPGVFSEFTWNRGSRLSVVGGIRGDYHNVYGALITPRLHARWSVTDRTSIKISAGTGYRSPNLIMDHVGVLASNRTISIEGGEAEWPFGLRMERATTLGIVIGSKFKLFYRDAAFTVDVYRTDFQDQIVADWETPTELRFYNLNGVSWSNSAQAELQWSPVKRLEWRIAYRWLDAQTTYGDRELLRPLVAQHRFFTNVSWETRASEQGAKWVFDVTARWLGRQRLPSTFANPEEHMLHTWSDAYWIINAQVAYHVNKKLEFYVGGENLGNFMIMNPIIAADQPDSPYFDASLVWGPVFGRMGYVGLRWRIGADEE